MTNQKNKRICQAFVKANNSQCQKKAFLNLKYCWWHYPKESLIISTIVGGFIGLVITLIFNDPLIKFFSKIPLFYYCDKIPPQIEKILPDIQSLSIEEKDIKSFLVQYREDGSGIDLSKSSIVVKMKDGPEYKLVKGELKQASSELEFTPTEELQYGEYLFETSLVDRGRNKISFEKTFIVKESCELDFGLSFMKYEDFSEKRIFNAFLEAHSDLTNNYIFYVYVLGIKNKTSKAIVKDINVSINPNYCVFACGEILNIKVSGVEFYDLTPKELKSSMLPAEVFLSQKFLRIENISPGGHVLLAMLVGDVKQLLEEERNKNIFVEGSYFSECFGIREVKEIKFDLLSQ